MRLRSADLKDSKPLGNRVHAAILLHYAQFHTFMYCIMQWLYPQFRHADPGYFLNAVDKHCFNIWHDQCITYQDR